MGVRYLSEGNYEDAIIAFTAAIEIEPRAEAYIGRGQALLMFYDEENSAAAIDDFDMAIELDPSATDAWQGLIEGYRGLSDWENALKSIDHAREKLGIGDIFEAEVEEIRKQLSDEAADKEPAEENGEDNKSAVESGGEDECGFGYDYRTETVDVKTSSGETYYVFELEYPVFWGDTDVTAVLNRRYEQVVSDYRTPSFDVDTAYWELLEFGGAGQLPFYENYTAEVVFDGRGVLSVLETVESFSGGVHPYTDMTGLTYDKATGQQLALGDILTGSEKETNYAVSAFFIESIGRVPSKRELSALKEGTSFSLSDAGLCFYFKEGDAVQVERIIIPFTLEDSFAIDAGAYYKEIQPTLSSKPGLDGFLGVDINEFATQFGTVIDMNECSTENVWVKASFQTDKIYSVYLRGNNYSLAGIDLDMSWTQTIEIAESVCDLFVEERYLRGNAHIMEYMLPGNILLDIETMDEITTFSVCISVEEE